MPVIKIKKRSEPDKSEDNARPKRLRITTRVKDEPEGQAKVSLTLKKSGSSARSKNQDKSSGMKLKLNLKKGSETEKVPKTPRLRLKPIRVPGEGYDSEASDIEDDPLIEEGVILRVLPDIQAEFVKHSIDSGDYSGISIKWKGQRHAVVNINDVSYGAILVNLPTIIEVNKSVDRKNLLKTIDVSQMLLCVQVIENEEDVFTLQPPDTEDLVLKHFEEYQDEIRDMQKKFFKGYNDGPLTELETKYLDQMATKPYDYKHGLTPPLYNVRNRRFRRKMGLDEFDYVEQAVERLLKQDDQAEEINYELVDEDEVLRRSASASNLSHFDQPALPLAATEHYVTEDKDDDDLDLDEAFQSDNDDARAPTAAQDEDLDANELFDEAGDDVEQYNGEEEEEEDEEEPDDDEDADENNESVQKQAVDEGRQHNELLKDELHELETTLNHARQKLQKAANPLLKSRFIESIKKLEKEAELKRKQLKASDETLHTSVQDPSAQETPSAPAQTRPDDEEDDEEEEDEEDEEPEPEEDDDDQEEDNAQDETSPKEQELDQNDLDMMMLFGAEGEDEPEE